MTLTEKIDALTDALVEATEAGNLSEDQIDALCEAYDAEVELTVIAHNNALDASLDLVGNPEPATDTTFEAVSAWIDNALSCVPSTLSAAILPTALRTMLIQSGAINVEVSGIYPEMGCIDEYRLTITGRTRTIIVGIIESKGRYWMRTLAGVYSLTGEEIRQWAY